ncbi:hypothetical protein RCL1_005427 [Eukaryota sp. TZLM3-RCL]
MIRIYVILLCLSLTLATICTPDDASCHFFTSDSTDPISVVTHKTLLLSFSHSSTISIPLSFSAFNGVLFFPSLDVSDTVDIEVDTGESIYDVTITSDSPYLLDLPQSVSINITTSASSVLHIIATHQAKENIDTFQSFSYFVVENSNVFVELSNPENIPNLYSGIVTINFPFISNGSSVRMSQNQSILIDEISQSSLFSFSTLSLPFSIEVETQSFQFVFVTIEYSPVCSQCRDCHDDRCLITEQSKLINLDKKESVIVSIDNEQSTVVKFSSKKFATLRKFLWNNLRSKSNLCQPSIKILPFSNCNDVNIFIDTGFEHFSAPSCETYTNSFQSPTVSIIFDTTSSSQGTVELNVSKCSIIHVFFNADSRLFCFILLTVLLITARVRLIFLNRKSTSSSKGVSLGSIIFVFIIGAILCFFFPLFFLQFIRFSAWLLVLILVFIILYDKRKQRISRLNSQSSTRLSNIENQEGISFNFLKGKDHVKSGLFYLFLAVSIVFFWSFLPKSVVDTAFDAFCPPLLSNQIGHVTLDYSDPFFASFASGQTNFYPGVVVFNSEFINPPEVFVSITGIEQNYLYFQLNVLSVGVNSFSYSLTFNPLDALSFPLFTSIKFDWFAGESSCTDSPFLFTHKSPVYGSSSPFSPGWDLDKSIQGEKSFNSLVKLEGQNSPDLIVLTSLLGINMLHSFTNQFDLSVIDFNHESDDSSSIATQQLTTFGTIKSAQFSTFSINPSVMENVVLFAGDASLSINSVDDWPLATDIYHLSRTYSHYIPFQFKLFRTPDVLLTLASISTVDTFPKFSIRASNISFIGFTLIVEALPACMINSIKIDWVAIDQNPYSLDFIDLFLYTLFIIAVISGFLVDRELNKKNSIISQFSTASTSTKHISNSFDSPSFNLQDLLEWKKQVEHYLKNRQTKAKRSKVEVTVIMIAAFVFIVTLFIIFRDFVIETRLFHSFNNFWVAIFILGLEYGLLISAILFAKWPVSTGDRLGPQTNTAILIASHCSAGVDPSVALERIKRNAFQTLSEEETEQLKKELKKVQLEKQKTFKKTLELAHAAVGNSNVFVCHNSNDIRPHPQDPTFNVIEQLGSEGKIINYVYVPKGNKTVALKYVVKNILDPKVHEFTIVMDDDIMIPTNLNLQHSIDQLNDQKNAAGVVFVIRSSETHPNAPTRSERRTISAWFADYEYLLAGYTKIFQAEVGGTTSCPHGAISLWRTESLNSVFLNHNSTFHGEDMLMGLITREKLMTSDQPYRLLVSGHTPIPTDVPLDFFHPKEDFLGHYCVEDKSIFNQRVRSWDCCAHRSLFKFIQHILRYWNSSTLLLKLFYIHEVLTIVQDYFRVLIIVYYVHTNDLGSLASVFLRVLLAQYILFFAFNYFTLRKNPELQSPFLIVLLFPFYRLLLLVFRILALFYNLFEYLPKNATPDPNCESLKPPYNKNIYSQLQNPRSIANAWCVETIEKWMENNIGNPLPAEVIQMHPNILPVMYHNQAMGPDEAEDVNMWFQATQIMEQDTPKWLSKPVFGRLLY